MAPSDREPLRRKFNRRGADRPPDILPSPGVWRQFTPGGVSMVIHFAPQPPQAGWYLVG